MFLAIERIDKLLDNDFLSQSTNLNLSAANHIKMSRINYRSPLLDTRPVPSTTKSINFRKSQNLDSRCNILSVSKFS